MILSFERTLIKGGLITTSFKNIKNEIHEFKNRRKRFFFTMSLCVISALRCPMILYFDHRNTSSKENSLLREPFNDTSTMSKPLSNDQFVVRVIFGDYVTSIGNPGRIMLIWWSAYSVVGLICR